jgi:hypothetical protein
LDTIRNDSLIKLALDTIDLVILRWQVDEAMSNKPVDGQQYYRLTRARDLLAECSDGGASMNRSTRKLRA